jgi:hypothetical protein
MQADIVGTWVSSITATGTITLNAIPRQAQISSANNFTDEQDPTFTYSNAGGFPMAAYLSFAGNIIFRSGIGTATSGTYKFFLTEAERTLLRNATPNSNTMTVTYGLETVISGTTHTATIAKTMTVINASPIAPTIAYKDTNATTTAITGNDQRIVRNKSILTVTIGDATAKKGATIASYSTTINGITKYGNNTYAFGTINSAANTEMIVVVTDSRGNKTTVKKTIVIDDWSVPTASIQLYRINNFETESKIKVDATYSSLNGKNAITIQYRHKITTDSQYSEWGNLNNNALGTFQLNNNYDWNVQIQIRDHLSSWVTYSLILPKGKPIIFIDTDKRSVGVNCFPENENAFEVSGTLKWNGAVIVEQGSNAYGSYIKFADGTLICTKKHSFQTTCTNAWGSMFDSPEITIGWLPATFTDVPTVTAVSTGANSCFLEGVRDTTTSIWGKMWICRPVSTGAAEYVVDLIAIGKWK